MGRHPKLAIDERKYGWVVEVDPFGALPPVKHTALGRFKHENAAVRVGPTGRVVYLGGGSPDPHLDKFVSAEPDNSKASRADRRRVLGVGTLYAANLATGKWVPLTFDATAAAKKNPAVAITSQAHPLDGSLPVALTNSAGRRVLEPLFTRYSYASQELSAGLYCCGAGGTPAPQ